MALQRNPDTASATVPEPEEIIPMGAKPTRVAGTAGSEELEYDDGDSLVFYLTRQLTPTQDAEIRRQIEEPVEYYAKKIWYYAWTEDRDGTLADVERITYESNVHGKPKRSSCMFFIDRQSAEDGMVLIVECVMDPEEEVLSKGSIHTRGRLEAGQAPCAVVNSDLANMELIDFLNGGETWRPELHFHCDNQDNSDDDSLVNF